MRPATRQLASKATEIAIFGAAFLILMNIIGISLTSLAVLGGAVGVGLGFGLQKIASNFISGVIISCAGMGYRRGMVAKPCGVVSVYLIGRGLLWGRICHKKDEPDHHPHLDTTRRFNIGHCANTPFYTDVFAPIDASVGLCLHRHR